MKLDYDLLLDGFPWIAQKNQNCILSPDSDGFLCGLLVTNFLGWNVVGFYDGKVLICKDGVDYQDCVFLDIEINRKNIRSIGNHLVEYNYLLDIPNRNFTQSIQPNILRKFDKKKNFQQKYPLATIHLLLGILQAKGVINKLHTEAFGPLLFVDGVGNNLFGYPENCLDWISYLGIDDMKHILHNFLCENDLNFYKVMQQLKLFFEMRDKYNAQGYFDGEMYIQGGRNVRTGHQLRTTNPKGAIINLSKTDDKLEVHTHERERVEGFIKELAKSMHWEYLPDKWTWGNFVHKKLTKGALSDKTKRLNNASYVELMQKNPFSLAITASNTLEYSLED